MPDRRWKMPNRIPLEYERALRKLSRTIQTAIGKNDTPEQILRKLHQITYSRDFKEYAYRSAGVMVDNVYRHGKHRWRTTVMESPAGRKIYEAIQQELMGPVGSAFFAKIEENARLIRSAPKDVASVLTEKVQAWTLEGMRSAEMTERLRQEYPGLLKSRLELIARTETSKTQTALTQARATDLGLRWYIWRTSEDAAVRSSHRHMKGVMVCWDDPPDPERLDPARKQKSYGKYHAGNIFNCRCYPEPVVDYGLISWPRKVYHGGIIQRMTRAKFEQLET